MDIKNFLNKVCEQIKYEPAKKGISEELELHIQEIKDEYINDGISEIEAEEKAVSHMGEAEDIGKKLNKVHKPKLDWKLLILILILMGFGIFISVLKGVDRYNYVARTCLYMLFGIAIGAIIYFFDYRKLKSYSNIIYLIASIIMILPVMNIGTMINGINYFSIFNVSFMPCVVAVPLYVIAFVGYIVDYNKDNVIRVNIDSQEIIIKKDLLKIMFLSIFSLVLIIELPSLANAMILGLAYLVIGTVKIIQDKERRIIKLAGIYTPILIVLILVALCIIFSPYRAMRIISSFRPEIDPKGSGYTGMLQKEILENAKLIGEADTEVISSGKFIISGDTNFTFIYLLGKTGTLFATILVLIIILTSIKLILNSKNIKEQYGKFLTIGLSTLYIIQSVSSVLMNVNLGIKVDVNLPFVSYGAVHFIVSIVGIALILSVYRRKDICKFD